jgi:hypothetical protein
VDSGQWTVDSGQWTVDSGQWTVDSGQWTVSRHFPFFNVLITSSKSFISQGGVFFFLATSSLILKSSS